VALNRAELVRRLEALERQVGTHPDIPWDVERFVHLSDSVVMRCESCDAVNIPADVWDVCRRLPDGGYETLYGVMIQDDPQVEKEQAKKVWRAAEDQAYALTQVLDALPSLIQCLRLDAEDAGEGDLLPSTDGVALVAGPRHLWIDPAGHETENGIYEATVCDPPGCEVSVLSSAICQRGTQGCIISHTGESR